MMDKFFKNKQFNIVSKNVSWLFLEKVFQVVVGLFIYVLMAKYLGPEKFGMINYSIAFVMMFSMLADLGLRMVVVRELTKFPEEDNVILGTVLGLRLAGGIVAYMLILLLINYLKDGEAVIIYIVSVIGSAYLFKTFYSIMFYYQSELKSKYNVMANTTALVISSLLKLYLIIYKHDVVFFAYAIVVDAIVVSTVMIFIYQSQGHRIKRWIFNIKKAKELLNYSWPLIISTMLVLIHTRIDQIMIGELMTISDVGLYGVAIKLSEFWWFFPSIVANSLLPYFVNLRATDKDKYKARLAQLFSITFWIGVFVAFFTLLFGENIVLWLFGDEYEGSYSALSIHIWTGIFVSQSLMASIWTIAENMQRYSVIINLFAISMNISLNTLLIPEYGIAGAAIASLASIGCSTLLFPLLIPPLRKRTITMIKSVNPNYIWQPL